MIPPPAVSTIHAALVRNSDSLLASSGAILRVIECGRDALRPSDRDPSLIQLPEAP
jgi:hypothetical protein